MNFFLKPEDEGKHFLPNDIKQTMIKMNELRAYMASDYHSRTCHDGGYPNLKETVAKLADDMHVTTWAKPVRRVIKTHHRRTAVASNETKHVYIPFEPKMVVLI